MSKQKIKQAHEFYDKITFEECSNCSECCSEIWLLKQEYDTLLEKFGGKAIIKQDIAFTQGMKPCIFAKNNRCIIYKNRPFDCRIYPLDIQKIKNSYYWIIYTTCPQYKKFIEKIKKHNIIPFLNNIIKGDIFEQYKKQIAYTTDKYAPARDEKYIVLGKIPY